MAAASGRGSESGAKLGLSGQKPVSRTPMIMPSPAWLAPPNCCAQTPPAPSRPRNAGVENRVGRVDLVLRHPNDAVGLRHAGRLSGREPHREAVEGHVVGVDRRATGEVCAPERIAPLGPEVAAVGLCRGGPNVDLLARCGLVALSPAMSPAYPAMGAPASCTMYSADLAGAASTPVPMESATVIRSAVPAVMRALLLRRASKPNATRGTSVPTKSLAFARVRTPVGGRLVGHRLAGQSPDVAAP